jgi:hypothetical protein
LRSQLFQILERRPKSFAVRPLNPVLSELIGGETLRSHNRAISQCAPDSISLALEASRKHCHAVHRFFGRQMIDVFWGTPEEFLSRLAAEIEAPDEK